MTEPLPMRLYTAATPNGWKASIALEELQAVYTVEHLDLIRGEQLTDSYRRICPNGKIPALVDVEENGFSIFESGAILIYLAEKYGRLLPTDLKRRSLVLQWLFFQVGGVGPMMGQANVFLHYAPVEQEYARDRYQREVHRLLEVLDTRLRDSEFLVGDYSIADIANWSWAHTFRWSGVSIDGLEHLQRWLHLVGERGAVKRGLDVPVPQSSPGFPRDPAEMIRQAQQILT